MDAKATNHLSRLNFLVTFACLVALLAAGASAQERRGGQAPRDVWTGVRRVVAVGDVHGDYARFVLALRAAGIVDDENRWIAGDTHLVQTGDVLDRGPHSRAALDLLRSLEEQAVEAGGRVHFLIGNHEAMVLQGDFRYVHPGEYRAFVTPEAAKERDALFRRHVMEVEKSAAAEGKAAKVDRTYRRNWYAKHPLDKFQYEQNMAPAGRYGKWIRSHNTIVKINDVLFVHAGVSSKYAAVPIRAINDRIRRELAEGRARAPASGFSTDPAGPLWFRGLAESQSRSTRKLVERILSYHDVNTIVVGHTISEGGIGTPFGGRVVLIDVGMTGGAPPTSLLIENGRYYEMRNRARRRLR